MKPDLKVVPKPEGFDLRQRRADRDHDATAWAVHDALYESALEMDSPPESGRIDGVVIGWRVNYDDGTFSTFYRQAGQCGPALLVAILGKMMGWK